MKYEFIGKGKTREEASAAAKTGILAELAKNGIANPNEAYFHEELIAMPKKKILGLFGGSDAEVKFCYDDGRKAKMPQPKKSKPQAVKNERSVKAETKNAPKKDAPKKNTLKAEAPEKESYLRADKEAEVKITEKDIDMEAALSYVREILIGFQVKDAKVSGEVVDSALIITVDSDDCGIIIGRRGETLDSVQYLTSLVAKKTSGKYVRVILNVADYREKRTEAVKALARKNAEYVLRSGRRHTFEPMNPYERRIIHTTVQEYEGIESVSIGFGSDRRVVIQPAGGAKYQQRSGYSRRSPSVSSPKPAPKTQAAQKDFTKFGKIEVNKD